MYPYTHYTSSQLVVEFLEEGADPVLAVDLALDEVPKQFFRNVTSVAEGLFGFNDILTVKLQILSIFFNAKTAEDFIKSGGASTERLVALFHDEVPAPDTGNMRMS